MREASMLEFAPRRAEGVVVGPRMTSRGRAVHYVRNGKSSTFVRLGAREALFLALCDGRRSLRSIAAEMLARADVVLSDAALASLLGMLAMRGLVAGPGVPRARPAKAGRASVERRRFGERHVRLGNPDAWLSVVSSVPRTPAVCIALSAVLVAAAVEHYVVARLPHLEQVLRDLMAHPEPGALALIAAVVLLAPCCRELAQAVVCAWCGGRVQEAGLVFRYGMFFATCRLDDLVLLRGRARYAVVLAGVVANLLLLAPFAMLDRAGPSPMGLQACAFLLVAFNASCLLHLLPLLRLDGYLLISVCAGRPDLREEARAAMKNVFKPKASEPRPWALATFGFAHVAATIVGASWAGYQWLALGLATRSPVVVALPALLLLQALASQRQGIRRS
jgi:putative peptide zinc metalloprotease protein